LRASVRNMRANKAITALLPETRREILAILLLHADREWYFRDLAAQLGVQSSSLTRELKSLTQAGILRRREEGNRVYYQANTECPFYPELRGLMLKTAGLVDVIRDALTQSTASITVAFIYGSIARGEETSESDIDLMVIGQTSRFEMVGRLREAEQKLGRPINPIVYKPHEFVKKATSDDHFVRAVLDKEKLFVIGDAHDLERARTTETRHR